VDGCCDGVDCDPEVHRRHHGFFEKLASGLRYAFTDFWDDLAGYFFLGLILAGLITVLVPDSFFTEHMGAGLPAMLIMLVAGIPLYVCATASTPIAAALILKGVSPGAALVFLLVGPATNMATLTVLLGNLGKRSTAIYLTAIAVCAVIFGMVVDEIYEFFNLSATAVVGQAGETIPHWLAWVGVIALGLISLRPLAESVKKIFSGGAGASHTEPGAESTVSGAPNKNLPVDSCGPT
jgi:hypothetical protein